MADLAALETPEGVASLSARLRFWAEEKKNCLYVTYTIIQSITSSEMCSLHLTRPSAHTLGAVGSQCCSARGAVRGSVPCSSDLLSRITAGAEIQNHNLGLQAQCSIH